MVKCCETQRIQVIYRAVSKGNSAYVQLSLGNCVIYLIIIMTPN